jgi:hypothetical protein
MCVSIVEGWLAVAVQVGGLGAVALEWRWWVQSRTSVAESKADEARKFMRRGSSRSHQREAVLDGDGAVNAQGVCHHAVHALCGGFGWWIWPNGFFILASVAWFRGGKGAAAKASKHQTHHSHRRLIRQCPVTDLRG